MEVRMSMKRFLYFAGLLLFCVTLGAFVVSADEGAEVLIGHPIKIYPGCVQEFDSDQTILLTKSSFEDVKKFYDKNKIAGDKLEPFMNDTEKGIKVVYHKTIGGKNQSVQELEFTSRIPDTNIHDALGELKAQVLMGNHSEAEYNVLENKYKNLHLAYFKQITDDEGRRTSEGKAIYIKARNTAHPKKISAGSDEEVAAGKAKSQDMKKQMQELKAKGDFAGMMRLAQESNKSPRQTTAGAEAMDAIAADTWDLWKKCLEDISQAAYWTKLKYNGNCISQN